MKHYLAIVYTTLCLLFALGVQAQDVKVKSFVSLERDLIARTHERLDLNDDPAAVVRVSVPHAQDFSFEGNIIGDVIYSPGEAIVYLAHRSASITIKSDQYGTIKYDFPERVIKQKTYRLTLEVGINEEKKIRTLVMPIVGLGGTASFGAMVGLVRNTGPYIKLKTNLKSFSADMDVDDAGRIDGTDSYAWYNGVTKKTRFALTAGVIQRVKMHLYVYGGVGYGQSNYGWKTTDGEWVKNTDHSYDGLEVDLGAIYRLKNYAISVGYQTNGFKYHEATVGVGVMF